MDCGDRLKNPSLHNKLDVFFATSSSLSLITSYFKFFLLSAGRVDPRVNSARNSSSNNPFVAAISVLMKLKYFDFTILSVFAVTKCRAQKADICCGG